MNRKEILESALSIVTGERNQSYGNPEDNFRVIAELWGPYLTKAHGIDPGTLGPNDVAVMMILMKVARLANSPKHMDSVVDIVGYGACLSEVISKP